VNRSHETAETPPKLSQVAGTFRERMPASALRLHVDRVWTNELSGPAALDVIPDGCIDIYWTGSGVQVAGPNTQVVTVAMAGAADLAGVRFHPGVAARWLGVPASELLNRHQPLEDFWGRQATRLLSEKLARARTASVAAATLERSLIERLHRVAPDNPMIGATVSAMTRANRTPRGVVSDLIAEFGWSERTLRRHCHDAFGYGPKTLERILRFQRFLRLLPAGRTPLAVLAIEAGYADQAHLAREVHRLSGQSPSKLVSELQA
jgi:AraC-like DNA-binding protein